MQQGGALAEPQQPERQKEALKVMGKPLATNHNGKARSRLRTQHQGPGAGRGAQQRAAACSQEDGQDERKRYKGVQKLLCRLGNLPGK